MEPTAWLCGAPLHLGSKMGMTGPQSRPIIFCLPQSDRGGGQWGTRQEKGRWLRVSSVSFPKGLQRPVFPHVLAPSRLGARAAGRPWAGSLAASPTYQAACAAEANQAAGTSCLI